MGGMNIEDIFVQLSPEDEQILISLPYRAGLYVSFSDVTGGWEAQEKELQSLTGILRQFSEDFCKTEIAQKALMETLRARAQWPAWSHKIETVPDEAARIIKILSGHLSEKDVAAFKETIVDIALAVAMAFHENVPLSLDDPPRASIFSRLLGTKEKHDPLAHMNISKSERAALDRLCKAMSYTKI